MNAGAVEKLAISLCVSVRMLRAGRSSRGRSARRRSPRWACRRGRPAAARTSGPARWRERECRRVPGCVGSTSMFETISSRTTPPCQPLRPAWRSSKRHLQARLVDAALGPRHGDAVVGGEDHQRVLLQAEFLQRLQPAAELLVHVPHGPLQASQFLARAGRIAQVSRARRRPASRRASDAGRGNRCSPASGPEPSDTAGGAAR